jgi:hypothetical protein
VDLTGSGEGTVEIPYEHGNEPSGCIKGGDFIDCLSTNRLLNEDPTPCSSTASDIFIIYLFICSLFNDVFSNLDYTVSNERMIYERFGKYVEGSGRGLI